MQSLESLFDIFATNLTFYKRNSKEQFMCPLCLRVFSRNQIHSDLSKAHIIPRFLNGRDWTLTCTECNNRVGSRIESCEARRANFNWALAGDGNETTPVDVWLRDESDALLGPVKADMRGKECDGGQRIELYVKPGPSNPRALELLNSGSQKPFEMRYCEAPSPKRANLTYIHTAYLLMFHQFGYEWALNRCAELIRKQLMSPDEAILSPLAPKVFDLKIPDKEMAILLVTKPENWRYFVVVLPLFRGWPERQAVWMPLFDHQYSQPPQCTTDLRCVRVPEFHRSLNRNRHEAMYQGHRFIREHVDE